LVFVLVLVFLLSRNSSAQDFDILIKNGKIVDGSGKPGYVADIAIKGDTIIEIGNLQEKRASTVIWATDRVVSPGFIDLHTHCDRGLGKPATTANVNYLTQGVTTVVTGNCGSAPIKVRETAAAWEKTGIGTNAIFLAGLGTIRYKVIGVQNRIASPLELETMKSLLRQALDEGAWGLSAAFQYIPDRFASPEEIVELAGTAKASGGIFISHQRSEEAQLADAVRETIRISRDSGIAADATHLKASGKGNWGMMKEAVRLLEEARSRGVKVTADLYTYPECVYSPLALVFNVPDDLNRFAELLPLLDYFYILKRLEDPLGINRRRDSRPPDRGSWFESYTMTLAAALSDEIEKEQIKQLTLKGAPNKLNWAAMFGWDSFKIIKASKNKTRIGKTILDLAHEENRDPFDVAVELFLQEKNDLVISVFTMSETDIAWALKKDWMMVGSDAGALTMKAGPDVHPGSYGTFPRLFRKYVREEGILTVEEAVRKLSFLPARFLGLDDRGTLVKGAKADIVIFDPNRIQEEENGFDASHRRPGIDYVLINGRISLEKGVFNNSLNGRVLLHGR